MNDRSAAYALIAAYLPQFVAAHGRQPRLAEVQDYLEADHGLRSSTTTVSRALHRWRASSEGQTLLAQVAGTHDTPPLASPAANPLLATFAEQLRREITAEVDARLRAEARVAIEAAEAAGRAAAARADLAARRAELLVRDAEDRREREVAAALAARDAVQQALGDALAAVQRLTEGAAAERVALTDKVDRLAAENTGLATTVAAAEASRQAAEAALAQAQARTLEVSERAAAQYSGLMQTMTARLVALEQALHAAQKSLAQKESGLIAEMAPLAQSAMDALTRSEGLLRETQAAVSNLSARWALPGPLPHRRRISQQPKASKKS